MTAASRRSRLVQTASSERIIAAPVTTRAAIRKAAASVGGAVSGSVKSSIPVHKSHVVQKRGFVPSTPGQTPKMPAKSARTTSELLPESAYSPQPPVLDELAESSSVASHELFATPSSSRLGADGLPLALAGVSATPRHDDDVVEDGMRKLNVSGLGTVTATPEPNVISVDAPTSATKLTPRNAIPVRRSAGYVSGGFGSREEGCIERTCCCAVHWAKPQLRRRRSCRNGGEVSMTVAQHDVVSFVGTHILENCTEFSRRWLKHGKLVDITRRGNMQSKTTRVQTCKRWIFPHASNSRTQYVRKIKRDEDVIAARVGCGLLCSFGEGWVEP